VYFNTETITVELTVANRTQLDLHSADQLSLIRDQKLDIEIISVLIEDDLGAITHGATLNKRWRYLGLTLTIKLEVLIDHTVLTSQVTMIIGVAQVAL